MNKVFQYLLRLGVSCGILFILLKVVPYQQVFAVIRTLHPALFCIVVILGCIPHVLGAFRWQCLLSSQGISVPWSDVFLTLICGLFFNLFFPSYIASDVFRSMAISSKQIPYKKVISSVIVDRFSGMAGMAVVVVFSYLLGTRYLPFSSLLVPLIIFIGITGIGLMLMFSKRFFQASISVFRRYAGISQRLNTWHEYVYGFKKTPGAFMAAAGYSIIIQALSLVACYVLFIAIGQPVAFVHVMVILPLIMVLATIPITVSGIGTREAAMVYFFGLVGVRKEVSLAVSLISLVLSIAVGCIGGLLYVFFYHRRLQSYKNLA